MSEGNHNTGGGTLFNNYIATNVAIDQIGLPYDAESGPLDRADLFQFVTAWRATSVKARMQRCTRC